MSNVLQLVRTLAACPQVTPVQGVTMRTYEPDDTAAWLELRERAFARETLGVRQWTEEDFEQEFQAKAWWSPDRLWLAEADGLFVGTVSLALRGSGELAVPAVHWLMVHPRWRRRGIARWLVQTLESHAFDIGYRQVCLETHAAWKAAKQFYESLGYEPARSI